MPKVKLPTWEFGEVPSGIKNRNPVQDEFFNSSEALTEVSSLVRESIQNSLDAQDKSSNTNRVRVRFKLGEANRDVAIAYFEGLDPHLSAGIPGGSATTNRKTFPFLIVEDFNTSGLIGDSRKDQLSHRDIPKQNSYHYFVWAEGASAKTEGNRGRWGIGKIVFPRLSEIKSFFVLSKRITNDAPCGVEEILIGMSTLRGHRIGGKNYQPDGWWSSRQVKTGVPIPVDKPVVDKFKEDWGVSRNSEPGLSILIPLIPSFVTKEMIRDCVIRDYFIAIIQGLLEVEVIDSSGVHSLTKDNLRKECLDLGRDERVINSKSKEEQICLIDMVEDAQSKSTPDISVTLPKETRNKWQNVNLDPEAAKSALEIIESGQTLFCQVQVEIPAKERASHDSFHVYIRKYPEIRSCAVFSREGITIPSANPSLIKDHLVLVIANSGPLANLLADAEGPAHEKWSEKTDKFRNNYQTGKGGQLLTFVRKSPNELLFKIKGSGTERDSTALSNFFPLPGSQKFGSSNSSPKSRGEEENPKGPVIVNIPKNPTVFDIDESPRGFSIRSIGDNPALVGKRIFCEVAYRVRSGDSFAKWEIQDFDLQSIKPRLDGCLLRSTKGNRLIIEITGRKFRAVWGSFDPLRDLDVRANLTELELLT